MTMRTKKFHGWILVMLGILMLSLAACTTPPTPYQPLAEDGGYEETRLQDNVWRVSFKGNRVTPETDVLDFLYLRCAELTIQSGYTHFLLKENQSKTQTGTRSSSVRFGLGFGSGTSSGAWGMGAGFPMDSGHETYVAYHLGLFIIQMMNEDEIEDKKAVFDAAYLIESLESKKTASQKKES